MSLLLLVFVPKVLLAWKRAKEKQAKKQQGNQSISATSTEVEESGIRIIHNPASKRFVKHKMVKTKESQSSQMDENLQQLKVSILLFYSRRLE